MIEASGAQGGVIWITGYSGAGKTTVGRAVESQLRHRGMPTVFLDGDDLRRIFSGRWGFERAERLELAKVYFRLCSHLASQQVTVVISAIAMYSDVFEWVTVNIPRALQVYLRVPEEERIRRDRASKNLYRKIAASNSGYDEPSAAGLVIDNFGGTSPAGAAAQIVGRYLQLLGSDAASRADHGKGRFWEAYYREGGGTGEPSPFAQALAAQRLSGRLRILDVGCGNGRDSAYFASLGHRVWAIDASAAAIDSCRTRFPDRGIEFRRGTADSLAAERGRPEFDVVYCRFVLHAMTGEEEIAFCGAVYSLLAPGGSVHIECRSINDPLSRLGEVISPTERIHGHYRRFIVMDELVERLQGAGLRVLRKLEASGLARHGSEDPVVIRIEAEK